MDWRRASAVRLSRLAFAMALPLFSRPVSTPATAGLHLAYGLQQLLTEIALAHLCGLRLPFNFYLHDLAHGARRPDQGIELYRSIFRIEHAIEL